MSVAVTQTALFFQKHLMSACLALSLPGGVRQQGSGRAVCQETMAEKVM